jgi:hypothetical protein
MGNYKYRESDQEKCKRLMNELIHKNLLQLKKINLDKTEKELFEMAARIVWEKHINGKSWIEFADLEADLRS